MRVLALISTFAASTMALQFHGKVPFASNGTPLSHQLPDRNVGLTQGTTDSTTSKADKLGKRRLVDEYVPTSEEIENLRREFDDVIPTHIKRDSPVKLNGVVAIFSQEKGFMGYIALKLTQYATTRLTTDTSKVAFLSVPNATPKPHFDLGIYNASAPFLSVIQGYSGSNWGKGKPGYGSMTVVQHSTYPASNTNNPTHLPSESNIWTVNLTTGELTATWFNDNGKAVDCTIYYDVTYSDFGFTGDLKEYVKLYLDTTIPTTLYFVGLW